MIKNHSVLSSNKSLILLPVTKAFPQDLVQSSWHTSFTTVILGPEETRSTLTWPPVVSGPSGAPHCYFRNPSLGVKAGRDVYMGCMIKEQHWSLQMLLHLGTTAVLGSLTDLPVSDPKTKQKTSPKENLLKSSQIPRFGYMPTALNENTAWISTARSVSLIAVS